MKVFLLMMAAALIPSTMSANSGKRVLTARSGSQSAIHAQMLKAKSVQSPSGEASAILETPAGKLTDNMTLSEFALYPRAFEIYQRNVSGKVSAIVEGDDGCLYVKNPVGVYPTDSWLKLEHTEGTSYVAKLPQTASAPWDFDGQSICFNYDRLAYDEDEGYYYPSFAESELSFNYENGILTSVGEIGANEEMPVMLGLTYNIYGPEERDEAWAWYGVNDITVKAMDVAPAKLPEGVMGEKKVMNASGVESLAWMAVDGDNVYLRPGESYGYAVGKLADGKVTFESGQYLGVANDSHCYFYGGTAEFVEDEDYYDGGYTLYHLADNITFDYMTGDALLSSDGALIVNEGTLSYYAKQIFDKPVLQGYESVEAAPALPANVVWSGYDDWDEYGVLKFDLPAQTADGTAISKVDLYYNIYVDGSATPYVFTPGVYELINTTMTDVPYDFTDDGYDFSVKGQAHTLVLYEEFQRVGVQSINKAGDKEYKSEIVWSDGQVGGIGSITADTEDGCQLYDLMGRPVIKPSTGIYIRRQGTRTEKVIVR